MSDVSEAKKVLRRELRQRLRAARPEELIEAAEGLMARLVDRPEWHAARRVMLYAPMPEEPDVWPLAAMALQGGRRLALPRFDAVRGEYHAALVTDLARDVIRGSFGIREPAAACPRWPLNELDFVLVPGLGFDAQGRRLGRGKGYYDRLLDLAGGTACGVAMDWQILPDIPVEPHDRSVDCILTPSRWLAVARRADET
jgi:5-formyltetrahydrofolate cyclo-ligase